MRYRRNHDLYVLAERRVKKDYYVDKRNVRRVPYAGKVCCVEVPHHIIYVRRNGKAFWCGNCRFGYPTISVQIEGVQSPWGEFLVALASKQPYELKVKKGFQIGVCVAVPPYPYDDKGQFEIYRDLSILFRKQTLEGTHLGDVKFVDGDWRLAGESGYALVVTGSAITVQEARAQVQSRMNNIMLQNMFYRTDIGERWNQDSDKLQMWGYLY
jgi:phosphoribosylamine--glycine ligase